MVVGREWDPTLESVPAHRPQGVAQAGEPHVEAGRKDVGDIGSPAGCGAPAAGRPAENVADGSGVIAEFRTWLGLSLFAPVERPVAAE